MKDPFAVSDTIASEISIGPIACDEWKQREHWRHSEEEVPRQDVQQGQMGRGHGPQGKAVEAIPQVGEEIQGDRD